MRSPESTPFVIKVCGIRQTDEAIAAAEAGASAIGFNFYPKSPRYVSTEQAREIARHLAPEILKVGVFVEPSEDELNRLTQERLVDVVQIHGRYRGSQVGLRIWRAVTVDERFDPARAFNQAAEAFLLDAPADTWGGSGKVFDWTRVRPTSHKVLVAGGLEATNVAEAIAAIRPWGVDASSRLELAPGRKDVRKLQEFVMAARRAFDSLYQGAETPA